MARPNKFDQPLDKTITFRVTKKILNFIKSKVNGISQSDYLIGLIEADMDNDNRLLAEKLQRQLLDIEITKEKMKTNEQRELERIEKIKNAPNHPVIKNMLDNCDKYVQGHTLNYTPLYGWLEGYQGELKDHGLDNDSFINLLKEKHGIEY